MAALGERIHTSGRELKQQLLLHRLFDFVKPPQNFNEEHYLTEICSTLKRYDTVLVIGRFQPLHYGHILLMKVAARISDKVVIGIGSANAEPNDPDNPFSIEEREMWVNQQVERDELLSSKVSKIVRINDILDDYGHNDEEWGNQTLKITGHVDAVVGNNDWVNGILVKQGVEPVTTPMFARIFFEGKKCRHILREEKHLPQTTYGTFSL